MGENISETVTDTPDYPSWWSGATTILLSTDTSGGDFNPVVVADVAFLPEGVSFVVPSSSSSWPSGANVFVPWRHVVYMRQTS